MKVLLFGTGDYYQRYKKWFRQQEVVALLDNSVQKQHMVIDGAEVLAPEEGVRLNYDMIIILSFYVEQMKRQLLSLGVEEERICHFYELPRLFRRFNNNRIRIPLQYHLNAREIIMSDIISDYKILLMSTDLVLGGPSIALFHAAKVLKEQGYTVVFASMWDGPLREYVTQYGIPVVIDENLPISTMKETEWVNGFSLIICNTMNFHIFLSERALVIPVIWWLHDARFFYDGVDREVIGKIRPDNLKTVSVGHVPAEAIREFLPDLDCEDLLYAVQDVKDAYAEKGRTDSDEITCFITIGFLEDIKGQDILIRAVRKLEDRIRHKCRFYIVGHDKTLFGARIHKESTNIEEIVFMGSVNRERIHELLEGSDVLICPSREDSMPTVAAEAMMHALPCIVSDTVGTASYVHNGQDGFVFPCGDADALSSKIEWCVKQKEKVKGMGKEARKLYEAYFSMPAFTERLLKIVEELLPSVRGEKL